MLVAAHKLDVDSGSDQVYNALDTCLTHEIFTKLATNENLSQASPAYGFELALQAPVLEMMLRGFRVDPFARQLGLETCQLESQRLEYIINQLSQAVCDKNLNPNSGHQLKNLFYNHLGIEQIKVFKKGELTFPMDREVIEKISDYFQARPIANAVLAYRDLKKQIEVLETEVDTDWRMRTSYNIGGTKSARFSSSKSPTGSGTNLQNITEGLRHIFIPDPGYVLGNIDAEQSDSRMVGFMCGVLFNDWTYLDACESGDLHTFVVRLVWTKMNWTGDLKKDRKLAETIFYRHHTHRAMSKRLGHGTNFLGKAPTLAQMTHVPKPLVQEFQEKYFEAFPAIPKWHAWTANELQTKQQLVSIHGRKRDFFDRTNADETLRKGLAFLAAAPTADNLNLGMWRVWKHMPEVQLIGQVHDSIVFQFSETLDPKIIVPKVQDLLKTELTAPNGRKFSVPTDAKLGYNWGNKSEKNPKGLDKFRSN